MDTVLLQGDPNSSLSPLILIHAISGLALPYFALGALSGTFDNGTASRPIYGISSPIYRSDSRYLPKSLSQLAAQYIQIIRDEIQPRGPYILGGWSMGGMIAVEMASLLQAQNEDVQHVLLIDSLNPELYPRFENAKDHCTVAAITYNNIARQMNAPELGYDPSDADPSMEEIWSEISSHDESGNFSSSDSEEEDDDDGLFGPRMMQRMQTHIFYSLALLGEKTPEQTDSPHLKKTDVTLIKCSTLARLSSHISKERRAFAVRINAHPTLGWPEDRFRSFNTILFSGQHDSCFDSLHARELTTITRDVLAGL